MITPITRYLLGTYPSLSSVKFIRNDVSEIMNANCNESKTSTLSVVGGQTELGRARNPKIFNIKSGNMVILERF